MPKKLHLSGRHPLSIDRDLTAAIEAENERKGGSMNRTINDLIRAGLKQVWTLRQLKAG